MSLVSQAGRRWRSISFRSGLLSALSVGVVSLLALLLVTVLVFTLFVVASAVAEISTADRAEDQLLLGVEPADIALGSSSGSVEGRSGADRSFWAVLAEDGGVLGSSGDVRLDVIAAGFSDAEIASDLGAAGRPGESVGTKTIDGEDWFYLERPVTVADGSTYRVVVASDATFSLWQFVRSSLPVSIPILLTLMAVAMLVTSWLTRRALRRVEDMRVEVEQITQQSLDRRVPVVDASDDIAKLANTMNDMLERLESSNAQQAQFLADASHELRSPVAGLMAQLEVATTYPDRVAASALLPKLRDQAERLQLLVDDLLFLSRSEADSGLPGVGFTTVDVDELIAAEVAAKRALHGAVNIVLGAPSGAVVSGNRRDLGRALRNLVDNAIRHAAHTVEIEASVVDDVVAIRVADDGDGVAAEDAERIFDRFVRLDEARTRDDGGSGLGLVIASEIAAKHGGFIELTTTAPTGATFVLNLSSRPGTSQER